MTRHYESRVLEHAAKIKASDWTHNNLPSGGLTWNHVWAETAYEHGYLDGCRDGVQAAKSAMPNMIQLLWDLKQAHYPGPYNCLCSTDCPLCAIFRQPQFARLYPEGQP